MENYSGVVTRSSLSQPMFVQYPQYNYTTFSQPSQQSAVFNHYNNVQNGTVSYCNEVSTKPASMALVKSVITIGNQESALPINQFNQHTIDLNYNNQCQRNYEYGEAAPRYNANITTPPVETEAQQNTSEIASVIVNPDDFLGELNFEFLINREENRKKSFVYSKLFGKVFISMKKILPVQFSWRNYSSNLRVRACMIFKDSHSRKKPVQRCLAHRASDLPENEAIEPLQLKFTFRTNQWGSFYEEDANEFLSIVTPVGQPNPGCDYFQIDYEYFCMTSCVTGINRRSTFLVFTLENENGHIFGRQSLPIQICSCPKRDMEKEEGRTLDLTANAITEKKIQKIRKIDKPQAIQPTQWVQCTRNATQPSAYLQHSTMHLPQPNSYLPKPTSNYPQPSSYTPQGFSYLRQPFSNSAQNTSALSNLHEKDELYDLNLKILGAEEYLAVLEFAYRLLLKDGQENNKLDKHCQVLNSIRLKIDEFKRTNP